MRTEAARGVVGDGWADGWNPHSSLRCMSCGATSEERRAFLGCGRCAQDCVNGPLEVVYAKPAIAGERPAVLGWIAREWQPIGRERRCTWTTRCNPAGAVARARAAAFRKERDAEPHVGP